MSRVVFTVGAGGPVVIGILNGHLSGFGEVATAAVIPFHRAAGLPCESSAGCVRCNPSGRSTRPMLCW